MQKFLTDVHNHSTHSFDGVDKLSDMLASAHQKGVAFYGVSEHFDYENVVYLGYTKKQVIYDEEYFHNARHLQEDYAGCINVLIGCEFGFAKHQDLKNMYREIQEKYAPDFIVNSVHRTGKYDYYTKEPFYENDDIDGGKIRPQREVYEEYLSYVKESLDVDYAYDIVGHIGYASRYAPYEKNDLKYEEYAEILDDILQKIIAKGKILEINSSNKGMEGVCLPHRSIIERYFALGGRKVSYASDAHCTGSILRGREKIVEMLKEIGFTHVTVPCKGEYIQVEL